MARLNNPLLESSSVVLSITVVFGELVLVPLLKMAVAMLESFVTSVEVAQEPLPQLQVSSKEYEFVDVVQPVKTGKALSVEKDV